MSPRETKTKNEHVRKGIQKSAVYHHHKLGKKTANKCQKNAAIRGTKCIKLEDWEVDVGEARCGEVEVFNKRMP